MPHNRAFAQVDVFSADPYRGNPVAVILDAEGLSETDMARIANWTNLSETTFVLPPTNPDADYRLRIFTPARELPFAGHPTLGSAAAWLEAGGVPRNEGTIVQECGLGLVTLRRGDQTLSFAAPEPIRSGDLDEDFVEQIAAALHVERTEILGHQWVDNGPGWAAVRLASAQQVLDLEPDFSQIPDTKLGVLGPHPDDSAHEYEIRAFVPGTAIGEDPVTGSLNASVAQWLIKSGLAPEKYTATQGTALGRAGVISISHEDDEVWVGGPTTVCFKGTAFA
ncbi:PhzF family phenazine biosynthesis protein [Brevibacterium aurantiacum]|uniref:Phenazine biosynthesis protein PhzF family n=1 Tax=Brevibacterium aurantiacum TaxID=273384 RepID=A0A1D7VYG7_BREAU|nr:PhzF family phenazine biosynthesis protein [Brevibacterium aurantiacum]AOP51783.1 Phenazine biosynthesis protein PhzF like [Brevibacterium aurantiacum]AZL11423.1 PhzF family phenazine biosynthesis protein [Brevibacterium aurantiacum]AZT91775.1 PhzF family phenazine biosynthesis protein [Brevibacterium aurantiacum]AZT95618.1 PhzF family phenazine biosynthesis protein [Brevibacterium aurantiacum]MDN5711586.1 PhzF family phenazine biosynthesis protein [Brevibacterium aurantiacum]